MQKFHGLLLAIAISFFTLILCKLECDIALKTQTATYKLKNNHSSKASAISIINSSEELLNFDEYKKQPSVNHFYTNASLTKIPLDVDSSYLKTCDFFDYSLTVRTIIYPFHSFL